MSRPARAIAAIRRAKDEGLNVTCDTAPPYFTLNETAVGDYRTFAKLSPPLRSEADRAGGRRRPRRRHDRRHRHRPCAPRPGIKRLPFAQAEFGVDRAGDAAAAVARALPQGRDDAARRADAPDRRAGATSCDLPLGRLAKGAPADLVLFDLDRPWIVDADRFRSKSKNSPFDEWPVQGRVLRTVVAGRTVFAAE